MISKSVRKKLTIALGIIITIIFLFCLFLIIAVLITPDPEVYNELNSFGLITYEFNGKSEHFSFETGKVYFSENYNQFYIADFKQTKKIKNLKNEKVTIYFDKKMYSTGSTNQNLNKLGKKIKVFDCGEKQYLDSDSGHEGSFFDLATVDNFKDNLVIEMTYCTKDDNCQTEQIQLNYVN